MPWYIWPVFIFFCFEVIVGILMMTIWRENKNALEVFENVVFNSLAILLVLIGWYEEVASLLATSDIYIFIIFSILASYHIASDFKNVFFKSKIEEKKIMADLGGSIGKLVVAINDQDSGINELEKEVEENKAKVDEYTITGLLFLVSLVSTAIASSISTVFS